MRKIFGMLFGFAMLGTFFVPVFAETSKSQFFLFENDNYKTQSKYVPIQMQVISRIRMAKRSIKYATFGYVPKAIAKELVRATNRSVNVKISSYSYQSKSKSDKFFMIFDESEVVVGAYNGKNADEESVFYNITFLKSPRDIAQYLDEFNVMDKNKKKSFF